MDQMGDKRPSDAAPGQPEPLQISRVFSAPRPLVFEAWTSAEHVRHWFCPEAFSIPEARIEKRVGGPFEVCMRAPDGTDHWTRGSFAEISPHDRLVLDLYVDGDDGHRLFNAWTEIDFADAAGGTRIDVVQSYTFADPAIAAGMVAGAPEGWRQTLDKLDREIQRMQGRGSAAKD